MNTDLEKANENAMKNAAQGKSPSSRFVYEANTTYKDSKTQGENNAEAAFSADAAYPANAAYAASASPPGISGIAVIRMSGKDAFEIADAVFKGNSSDPIKVNDMKGYTCAFGDITDPMTGEVLDSVILTKFMAPHSYTGEDTIEISCHGGSLVRRNILNALYTAGARPAIPGEFTRNAFLNGKMDLAQAEAVMDLISATARKASSEAIHQMSGSLSGTIREISKRVYSVMSGIEMIVEFPEHEQTEEKIENIDLQIRDIGLHLELLIQSFNKGRILKEGMTVVIAGKPNAGKSSMLNTLAGYERAIVTATPGTTRDTIEESVDIEGLPVRLIDTAGLRMAKDEIEKSGIDRARKAIECADLVFWIFSEDEKNDSEDSKCGIDISSGNDEDLKDILSLRKDDSVIFIIGKSDITPFEKNREILKEKFPDAQVLPFSSVTNEGVEAVRDIIRMKYDEFGAGSSEEVIITNARHYHALLQAKESLELAERSIDLHMPVDLLSSVLRNAAESLAQITGDEVTQELVDEIFSRFCIGK